MSKRGVFAAGLLAGCVAGLGFLVLTVLVLLAVCEVLAWMA